MLMMHYFKTMTFRKGRLLLTQVCGRCDPNKVPEFGIRKPLRNSSTYETISFPATQNEYEADRRELYRDLLKPFRMRQGGVVFNRSQRRHAEAIHSRFFRELF